MKVFFTLALLIFTGFFLTAQNIGKITVTVRNQEGAPLQDATAELLRSKDSSLIKAAVSDAKGNAEFEKISARAYLVRISLLGFTTGYSPLIYIKAQNAPDKSLSITLQPAAKELGTVTINSRKPSFKSYQTA